MFTTRNLTNLQISNFNLPVIHITNISRKNTRNIIKENIKKIDNFLQHTPVVINVAKLTDSSHWEKVYQSILDTKLYVIGVCSCNNNTLKKIIIKSGLPILNENQPIKKHNNKNKHYLIQNQKKEKKIEQLYKTQFINKPIRSGQKIYARNSDLIIVNNISSGAEIISDGNIHIYGIMRGRMLAGASGNKTCQIFCTFFFPELVSINGHYLRGDQIPEKFIGQSVRLYLLKNTLTINLL